jgi:hypothetical protein
MKPLLPVFLLLALVGCRKVDFGPDEGYTARDAANYPMAYEDKTDWTSDKDWKKVESELFKDIGVDLKQNQVGGVGLLSLFPNPAVENVTFYIQPGSTRNPNTAPALHCKAVLVDKKYRELQTLDLLTRGGNNGSMFAFRLPIDKLKAGQLYRMYYVFYDDSKTLYLKGHGDIKIAE